VKRAIQSVVALAIAAAALWFTVRDKPLDQVWRAAREADYRYLAPYVATLLAIHLARTVRWGILLEPVAKVPFSRLNAVSAVGFMALMLLPFRLGEFARPYLISGRDVRVSAAMSSVVVERVADGLFTALLLVVTLLAVPGSGDALRRWRWGGALVFLAFLAVLGFLVLAYRNRSLAVRIAHRIVDPLSPRAAARIAGMLDAFIHGLRLVPSRGKVALFFALTAAYWGVNGLGMQLLARGFGLHLDAVAAFSVLGILVVGVMIPAPPGMIGTFQAFVVAGLSLFVPPETAAGRDVAYAFVLWGAQLLTTAALGVAFLFSRHIPLGRILRAPSEVEEGLQEEEARYVAAQDSSAPARAGRDGPGR